MINRPVVAIRASKEFTTNHTGDFFSILITKHLVGEVYYCGWSSKRSFGASSWLILREEGNVHIDSPRWSDPLARRITKKGA